MATYYWVGGVGTWNTGVTANWASSSGGAGGAGYPLATDNIIIDTSSGTGLITCVNGGSICFNLTVTATQAINIGSTAQPRIYGSLSFPSSGSFLVTTPQINMYGSASGLTINTGSTNLSATSIQITNSALGYTLASNIVINVFTLSSGTFNTGNFNLTCNGALISGFNTRSLTLGTSTITVVSGTWDSTITSGLTFSGASATFVLSNASAGFAGGGLTYNVVNFTSTALTLATITGANTYSSLSFAARAASGIGSVTISANQTITTAFTVQSGATDPTRRLFIKSDVVGTQRTITSAVNTLWGVDFQDINAAGIAVWSDSLRTQYWGNALGNTGITFSAGQTAYWNLAGSQNWSAVGWAPGSGGTPAAANFPLVQDIAVFDNAGSTTSVAANATYCYGTIDMSLRTSAMTFTFNVIVSCYGSFKNGTGTTIGGGFALFFVGRSTQTLLSNGKSFGNQVRVDSLTGTLNLSDDFTAANGFLLVSGAFNTQNHNISATTFNSTGTVTRALTLGASIVTLSSSGTVWNLGVVTGLTFSGSASTIIFSDISVTAKTFAGGGLTYGTLQLGATGATTGITTYTITGANTFATLSSLKTVASTITFPASTTTNIGTWLITGSAGNVVTVQCATVATATVLNITNRTSAIDYLIVQDITANLAPVVFYAGANTQLLSNNKGVAAIAPTSTQSIYVLTSGTAFTVPANWDNANNEIHLFGGGAGGSGSNYNGTSKGAGGAGGGGGGYTKTTNVTLSGTIVYAVGAGGAGGLNNGGAGGTGGSTTFNSGAYSASGGSGGTVNVTVPSSTGGAGGTGSTFNGGTGGNGSTTTVAAAANNGGGGGGGAGGPLGVGAIGGNAFAGGLTVTDTAGGGGGGNGGGTAGGNASIAVAGTGGNNNAGVGGGAAPFNGGGSAGVVGNTNALNGSCGIDIVSAGMGGGSGAGGAGTGATPNTTPFAFFGGGGNGNGLAVTGAGRPGTAGAQGGIILVYGAGAVLNVSNFFFMF